jgi:hypothetical protein
MSDLSLRFLPWLRRGLARSITPGTADSSATIAFSLNVGGEPVLQTLRMRGPGDVVGIDPGQIIRVEPRSETLDFEPNYFPAVEFATPDLPWMFTPTVPDADDHLLPWLNLITVSEESATIETRANVPLPVLTVPLSELPPDLSEVWAWAHVQTTSTYKHGGLSQALNDTPEAFISRILSPRNLQPDTDYMACLVPTFKAGVLAGLGLPVGEDTGQTLAWSSSDSSPIELPVYYSWSFRTGSAGDFETLVTRLQPRELDETVGRRDLDITELTDLGILLPKDLPDTTYFFGALVSPTAMLQPEPWSKPPIVPPTLPKVPPVELPRKDELDPVREALYGFLTSEAGEPGDGPYDYRVDDPVVSPAIYGREQLKGEPLPAPGPDNPVLLEPEEPIWYSVVNTLPRTRGAAGLGVRIVRQHQEDFMAQAWSEVMALRAINQTLQQATYASLIANRWQSRVAVLGAGEALQLTRSAHARILPVSGKTIWGQVRAADVPNGVISMDFQRMVRTGGVVHHTLRLTTGSPVIQHEIRQIVVANPSHLMALSAHALPAGAQWTLTPTQEGPGSTLEEYTRPVMGAVGFVANQLDTALDGGISLTERPEIADAVLMANRLASDQVALMDALVERGYTLSPEMQATRSAANTLVKTTDQYVTQINKGTMPTLAKVATIRGQAQTLLDRFNDWRQAGVDIVLTPGNPVEDTAATLEPIATALQASLTPAQTISTYLQSRISLTNGAWGVRPIPSRFTAAPLFEDALYSYVCELSAEYMLPGIGDLPSNTVGLVEANGEFIEAVLIGCNHEMSREMRWREYPADLSSTWFKRFWSDTQDDIGAIGGPDWPGKNTLGENLIGQLSDASLVLLIKGDILKRYPNMAVYALPATVTTLPDENGTLRRARVVQEPEAPHFPVFSGELDTGVKFFGFDELDYADVLGDATPDNTSTDGGYFFALQEQPTEPRFGLNEYEPGTTYRPKSLVDWSDLSWGHFMTGTDPASPPYLPISGAFSGITLPDSAEADAEDSTWGSHAAEMARIVLQRPVRMLVHASAMLP